VAAFCSSLLALAPVFFALSPTLHLFAPSLHPLAAPFQVLISGVAPPLFQPFTAPIHAFAAPIQVLTPALLPLSAPVEPTIARVVPLRAVIDSHAPPPHAALRSAIAHEVAHSVHAKSALRTAF